MLTVVDEYTRQALAVHVAHKMALLMSWRRCICSLSHMRGHTIYVLITGLSSQLKCFKSGLPR